MRRSPLLIMLGTLMFCSVGLNAEPLPVPPLPPAHRPLDDAAPVPNLNAQAPILAQSNLPSIDLKLYRVIPYEPGMAFTPGSRYQTSEDRKPIQTPGLSISVPLR